MNNYYKLFYYILITIVLSVSVYANDNTSTNSIIVKNEKNLMISSKDNFKGLCNKLEQFDSDIENLKKLNAYDRSEEKIKIINSKNKFLSGDFIIKLSSKEFELGDYNFTKSSFDIKNIKFINQMSLSLEKPIRLNVKKENAKMIAAKKELGILDLYLKVKLKDAMNLSCKDKVNFKIKPYIYEYFFMCARSNNIIDYEILHHYKDKFIKTPHIDLDNISKKKKIDKLFTKLERNLHSCRLRFNGYGMKIYQINIEENGDKEIINKSASFNNENLRKCINTEIEKINFPKCNHKYSIYFSVVLGNLD